MSDKIDCTNKTSGWLDLDVESTGRGRSDDVEVYWKRFLRRPIVITWHRNCLAATDGVTLAFNIPFARSHSTYVNFVTAK